jgi:CMP-N-acetylneuraminic acid synthetase
VTSVIALLPMRHHSERVPEKNFREVAGKPLYAHIVETLLKCGKISSIVVDTDSPTISRGITEKYPSVDIIDRPEHLRDGRISMNEVLLHDVSVMEGTYFIQTHSTNPLLRSETIDRAIEEFLDGIPRFDSLFSVTKIQTRFWDENGMPINHDPKTLLRTQDLTPMFEENSCIYIFEREAFLQRKNRIGERPYLFEIDALEALDIDEEADLLIAESILRGRHGEVE